ncbi:hypothetical protein OG735_16845 [Streptomyces sp. NBC_01210]|uniref:hypothetical protein n=1 Tax=Streptomyces sp. NBC_01210 TaxID=2903774 RepID=UPI002E146880|nr:hypothetical protein OG735_16845 [Streptomyces sp. NBC_01210]
MTEIDRLAGLFAALGADDAHGWARSEAKESSSAFPSATSCPRPSTGVLRHDAHLVP